MLLCRCHGVSVTVVLSLCCFAAVGEFFGEGGPGQKVQLVAVEAEQPLPNFEAFTAYSKMVEEMLERFAEKEGVSHEVLVEACALMQGVDGGASMCIDYIIATVDYETFLGVVYDFRQLMSYTYDADVPVGMAEALEIEPEMAALSLSGAGKSDAPDRLGSELSTPGESKHCESDDTDHKLAAPESPAGKDSDTRDRSSRK